MIVMPTAGHQGFLDALRGSTTEQVFCPVLAVRAATLEPGLEPRRQGSG